MGSKTAATLDFDNEHHQNKERNGKPSSNHASEDDQSELGMAVAKAVTQVLESSDWRALSFPLQANAAKQSKAKNAVKRPMNPFMLYAQAARKKLSNLYPDLSYAKLSKTLGRIWKSLDQVEKQPFIDEAERLRQKHKIDHPDYKFQPKRREKKRNHSPDCRNSYHTANKVSTSDVLKALSSGNPKHQQDLQSHWAHTIQSGIPSRPSTLQPTDPMSSHKSSSPPSYDERHSPTSVQSKIRGNSSSYSHHNASRHPATTTSDLTPFSPRYLAPPPPLHRSSTASLFSPTAYRMPKSQVLNQPPYQDVHGFQAPHPMQNYPSDLSLAIGNSFLKCSPQLIRPPHLNPHNGDLDGSGNLLTGVNQILRDMFGNEKNSVM